MGKMSAFKKIVLKSTTVMSLNERFTYLRGNHDNTVRAIRETTALQHQASARNRRLAQQMERRPAVMAALKLKKWSVRQRLGQPLRSTVKDRLTLPSNIYTPSRGRGRGRASLRGRGVSFSRGVRGSRFNRGSITPQRGNLSGARTSFRRPGRSMRNIGGMRGGGRRGGPRGGSRGARGGPRGGPRGSARGRQQKLPSKEELDLQLDQYMANTKSHLDKELDSYMNQAPAENWD